MKKLEFILLFCLCSLSIVHPLAGQNNEKPRVIATTDGEIDDRCSMVRFFLYANEWDIEGIIYSSSRFHWKGHNWAGETWIQEDINKYAKFYDNLLKHDPEYPSPKKLKEIVYIGNIDSVGSMSKDTPGSERIVEILLDDKPGPVYLQAWGGTNTIARALWKIQHEHPNQMAKVARKAIIYIILDQDETFRNYIQPNWPNLQVLRSFRQYRSIAYSWEKFMPDSLHTFFEGKWMNKHILDGHGPLCSRYETHDDGSFRSEGDSPSFMHQINVGLRGIEHPTYGSWGGRFTKEADSKNVWKGAKDDGDIYKPIWRWAEAFQNDWAARADWCVKSYKEANHPPEVTTSKPVDMHVLPDSKVDLSVKGTDPDGDKLSYHWWQYKDPESYKGDINLHHSEKRTTWFKAPANGHGKNAHIICSVKDNGKPPLTRYKRFVVHFDKNATDTTAISTFQATQLKVPKGKETQLYWTTWNADKVMLNDKPVEP